MLLADVLITTGCLCGFHLTDHHEILFALGLIIRATQLSRSTPSTITSDQRSYLIETSGLIYDLPILFWYCSILPVHYVPSQWTWGSGGLIRIVLVHA